MKVCPRCGIDKPTTAFAACAKARDGRQAWCQACMTAYLAEWRQAHPGAAAAASRRVKTDPARRRANADRSARRHPEKVAARRAVAAAIRRGDMPRAKDRPCTDCGDPADAYDHARGYDDALDVEPVCHPCHGARSRSRGEHANSGPARTAQ